MIKLSKSEQAIYKYWWRRRNVVFPASVMHGLGDSVIRGVMFQDGKSTNPTLLLSRKASYPNLVSPSTIISLRIAMINRCKSDDYVFSWSIDSGIKDYLKSIGM